MCVFVFVLFCGLERVSSVVFAAGFVFFFRSSVFGDAATASARAVYRKAAKVFARKLLKARVFRASTSPHFLQ